MLQCLEAENYVVRMRACKCLGYMLPTQRHNRLERKLYEVAIDPSDLVRSHILRMCHEGNITDNDIKQRWFETRRILARKESKFLKPKATLLSALMALLQPSVNPLDK